MAKYNSLSSKLQEQIISDRENHVVNPYAFKDENVVRRDMNRDRANLWRPAFVRDTEKIMNIPYYNRYADKTQVFSLYKNDDISRRSYHVQLVARIARNIGSLLGLNPDLIEAISLGHDIGHTPFGHAGEAMLDKLYRGETTKSFNHNIQSVRVLDKIFPFNISLQTLDGVMCHNGEIEQQKYEPQPYSDFAVFDERMEACYISDVANKKLVPATLEACVMRVSDIIAYLGKDRQDAVKLGMIDEKSFGTSNAEIINNMVVNIVENSYGKPYLKMDREYFDEFSKGKEENGKRIYEKTPAEDIYKNQIEPMMEAIYYKLLKDAKNHDEDSILYRHHINYIKEATKYYPDNHYENTEPNQIVVDYISSMTDDYFIDLYKYLFPDGEYGVEYVGYFD